MIRRLFAATALALGAGVALAPTTVAQGHVPAPGFQPASQSFVTPLDPNAWRPAPKWIVVSPYGTNDIYCASGGGWTDCYQLDPAGDRHNLVSINAYTPRLWVFNPAQSS